MAEVFLDPAAVARAARDLSAVGASVSSSAQAGVPDGQPWGSDEAGAAFSRVYEPLSAAALAAWSSVGVALSRLGGDVWIAASSISDADDGSARRFGRPS
ncbi:hypothetical protein Afe04nite_34200 [Asanoa ferruginea]|nr:hypothetical protein [Asanoa ferruginea]GIF48881.1 hypothetical protein Afe04nite_34200 [Asanoa ferruginea]